MATNDPKGTCPNCGHCPHCGHTPQKTNPWPVLPAPNTTPYPNGWWQQPYQITWQSPPTNVC